MEKELPKKIFPGNNIIAGDPAAYNHLKIDVQGVNNVIIFSSGFQSHELIINITGNDALISFGEYCKINGSVFCGSNSKILIGPYLKCNHPVHLRAFEEKSIKIGERCLFANVRIETSDYHTIFDINTKLPINPGDNINIGDRVWCTRDVLISKGADIGNDVVVGARSFVNRKFGNNCIIAGHPAKVIRENIIWTEERGAKAFPPEAGVIVKQ